MENKNSKALIITAHADDETIWMGGTILTYKDWHWRIIQLSQWRGESDRFSEQLQKAVEKYRKHGVSDIIAETVGLKDTMDEKEIQNSGQEAELRKYLTEKKDELNDFSIIFTHNSKGEYWTPNGHIQHRLANKVVSEIFKGRDIRQFCCPIHGEDLSNSETVQLRKDIAELKRDIFESCYPTEMGLWNKNSIFKEMDFAFNKKEEFFIKNQ